MGATAHIEDASRVAETQMSSTTEPDRHEGEPASGSAPMKITRRYSKWTALPLPTIGFSVKL